MVNLDVQDFRCPFHNDLEFLGRVKFQMADDTKAVPQRSCHASHTRCRPNESKARQVKAHTAGSRALADDDIKGVVFHSRIKNFFHGLGQAVDFIDKKHFAFVQIGQNSG